MGSPSQPEAGAGVHLRRVWGPLVLSVLLLGPILFVTGYLLTYDMVWVPDLALRGDFLGLGSGIPRAVPSDAWVAVLDDLLPGMVLQKLVLLGSLVAGGVGIQRWVNDERVTFGSTAAAAFYLWNPYVIERLAIGHWPMLVCYGLLPWVARAAARSSSGRRFEPGLLLLLPLASLNASAGLAAGVVVTAFMARSGAGRLLSAVGALLLANLPWIVAGAVKAGVLDTVAASAEVFAPSGEGPLPGPLTFLTLGGIWNSEVIPGSRTTTLAWVSVALVAIALVAGWSRIRNRDLVGWWACAAVGWVLAVLGWASPEAIDRLASLVPGTALLRDGSRLLLLAAPLLAIAVGAATDQLVRRAGELGPIVGACFVLLPVAVLPDAAWGMTGQLRPVDYPSSYAAMRTAVSDLHRDGDVLVLPFTAYRAPGWNGHRKVFDPVGRYQDRNYVSSDALAVSGRQLAGEDPRGAEVLAALHESTPAARAGALSRLGIGVVVTDRAAAALPGQEAYVAPVAGTSRRSVPGFHVVALDDASTHGESLAEASAVWTSWVLYVGGLVLGCWGLATRAVRNAARARRLGYTRRQNLGGK